MRASAIPAAAAATEYKATRSRQAAWICSRFDTSSDASFAICKRRAAASPCGKIKPVSESRIKSGPHPTLSLTMQGTPNCIASLTTSPHVSENTEGRTSMSASAYTSPSFSCGCQPIKCTLSQADSRAFCSSDWRKFPSPKKIECTGRPATVGSWTMASKSVKGSFLSISFPEKSTTSAALGMESDCLSFPGTRFLYCCSNKSLSTQ